MLKLLFPSLLFYEILPKKVMKRFFPDGITITNGDVTTRLLGIAIVFFILQLQPNWLRWTTNAEATVAEYTEAVNYGGVDVDCDRVIKDTLMDKILTYREFCQIKDAYEVYVRNGRSEQIKSRTKNWSE